MSKALNYNEQKVRQGKAEILSESGFINDAGKMNFYDKISHFERFTSLNGRATTNTLHVSLNFDPAEKISNEKMVEIADEYMSKIGFGEQPYLVYRHYDSAHPHIHIISTNIQADGKRISMHNLGRNQSENARRQIETIFNLVKAEEKKNTDTLTITPVDARKIVYGKSETRRAIASVLGPVINQYKFCSLAELNAVLRLYNVTADRGKEGSRIYRHNGLTYHILDEKGNKAGIPQKASAFFMKPTLGNLEKKFHSNEALKTPHRKRLQTAIAWVLNNQPAGTEQLINALHKENISVVLRKGKQDAVYGITYVDHKTKCVFNGSDLGKQYSAKAVLEKCGQLTNTGTQVVTEKKHINEIASRQTSAMENNRILFDTQNNTAYQPPDNHPALMDNLLGPVAGSDYVPYQLKKKKKKRKKQLLINR